MGEIFVNPDTDKILVEGESYRDPVLAETLTRFAERGASELYTQENGTGTKLVSDMAAAGGLMTMEDLASYRTSWEQPVRAALPNTEFTILSAPPPGSGAIHHQLYPNQVLYESGTTRWLVEGLQAFGHKTQLFPIGGSIVQALMVEAASGDILANADFRKGGGVAGF